MIWEKIFKPKESYKRDYRRQIILGILAVAWLFLYFKTFQIQVFKAEELQEELAQYTGKRELIIPSRGRILDRNGEVLVDNQVVLETTLVQKRYKKGHKINHRILAADSVFLDTLIERKYKRIYPWGRLASNLLGMTNPRSGHGTSGVEASLDQDLFGKAGWSYHKKDVRDSIQYDADYEGMEPEDGKDVYLTIDRRIQEIVEKALWDTIPKMNAMLASAIVVDVKNGDIVALANYPSNDPNDNRNYNIENAHNFAVQSTYEPGSIMKMLTAAAALESKSITERENWNPMCGLWVTQSGKKITDDHKTCEILPLPMAFAVSSNIVFAQIGMRAGERNLYRYLRNFGIGMRSGVELPGELPGLLKEISDWSGVSLPVISYGYEVKATPLQMAMAYAAVANGGTLFRPKIIHGWKDPLTHEFSPDTNRNKIRDVISPETAHILQKLAREVVENEHGTAHAHRSNIVSFAGKTGTANVWDSTTRGYNPSINNGSFAGWVPAENPKYAILVWVHKPSFAFRYGGSSAGPVFKDIAEKIYLSPELSKNVLLRSTSANKTPLGNYVNLSPSQALGQIRNFHWNAKVIGNGSSIMAQEPLAGSILSSTDTILLWTGSPKGSMPNLFGMSFGKARQTCNRLGLSMQTQGTGRVFSQVPAAGSPIATGQRVILALSPLPQAQPQVKP